jgi:hypothetical protein
MHREQPIRFINVSKQNHYSDFHHYPNPSNETFNVELSKPSNITVYSLDGQQLLEYQNVGSVVFGEQLKAGGYLVKIGNTFYKIVKE